MLRRGADGGQRVLTVEVAIALGRRELLELLEVVATDVLRVRRERLRIEVLLGARKRG